MKFRLPSLIAVAFGATLFLSSCGVEKTEELPMPQAKEPALPMPSNPAKPAATPAKDPGGLSVPTIDKGATPTNEQPAAKDPGGLSVPTIDKGATPTNEQPAKPSGGLSIPTIEPNN